MSGFEKNSTSCYVYSVTMEESMQPSDVSGKFGILVFVSVV